MFYYLSACVLIIFFLLPTVFAQTAEPTPTPETTPEIKTETEPEQTVPAPTPVSTTPENLIHLGDLIDVDIIGSTEYDWRGRLNPEGFLDGINFVDQPVFGLCRSEAEVAAGVAKGFSKFLKDPQVVVKILDRSGRPVSLLFGAVKTPQRFQIQRPVHLNELVVLSGGITEKASGEIKIVRPPGLSCAEMPNDAVKKTIDSATDEKFVLAKQGNETKTISVKIAELINGVPDANPMILNGDVVTVEEAQSIYVIGGVVNPKQINARSQLTVTRAIAIAGGFEKRADRKKVTVYRREKGETKVIEVDLEKIKSSPENDFTLQPLDIIEVTQTGRSKSKYPPIINALENKSGEPPNPPLKIID
jgi:protein involved in polysaccharide export with SLBB domain